MADEKEFPRFACGGWEDGLFEVQDDVEIDTKYNGVCKHCSPVWIKTHECSDGSTYTEEVCTIPKVVVAYNEGGFSSTGVCLFCILEAAKSLGVKADD